MLTECFSHVALEVRMNRKVNPKSCCVVCTFLPENKACAFLGFLKHLGILLHNQLATLFELSLCNLQGKEVMQQLLFKKKVNILFLI